MFFFYVVNDYQICIKTTLRYGVFGLFHRQLSRDRNIDEHLVTENFPIKMIRYENNGDDS